MMAANNDSGIGSYQQMRIMVAASNDNGAILRQQVTTVVSMDANDDDDGIDSYSTTPWLVSTVQRHGLYRWMRTPMTNSACIDGFK
jgi:hypothetical protein